MELLKLKIGLRVNKGNKEFVRVKDAVFEIGIGGGQVASAITTKEPSLSVHHSNFILEVEKMNEEGCKMIGMLGDKGFEKVRRVYSANSECPTIQTKEDRIKICEEKMIVAMRGREDGQNLEPNTTNTTNTITTVQKDNLCLEIKSATKEGSITCKVGGCYDASFPNSETRRGRVQEGGDVTPTITSGGVNNIRYVETVYRIRKLTPRECFRLMSFSDEDFENAAVVNSNTQLYKQAGNSICECVLKALFSQLGIKGVPKWNDIH